MKKKEIEAFLRNPETGIILTGQKGLGMEDAAYEIASSLLGESVEDIKNWQESPVMDFLVILPGYKEEKGKRIYNKSIGVDDIVDIFDMASLASLNGRKKVVIIPDIEKMTRDAQNKLLKTLEEKTSVVIVGICHDMTKIIPTVNSRMAVIRFYPLSETEFCEKFPGEDGVFYYHLTSGVPGEVKRFQNILDMSKKAVEAFADREPERLFELFHLLKEKDKESLFLLQKEKVPGVISLLHAFVLQVFIFRSEMEHEQKKTGFDRTWVESAASLYDEDELERLLSLLVNEPKKISQGTTYTKDDFFLFVAELVEV